MTKNHLHPSSISPKHPTGKARLAESLQLYRQVKHLAIRSREEVAALMHCSVERVRQIELSALWHLRHGYDQWESDTLKPRS